MVHLGIVYYCFTSVRICHVLRQVSTWQRWIKNWPCFQFFTRWEYSLSKGWWSGWCNGVLFGLHWGKPFRRGKSWWCVGSHDLSMISRWPICLLIVYLSVYKPICIYLSIYPSIHLSSWQYDTLWYNLIHYNILYYIIQQYTTIYCNLKQCNTIQYNIINTVQSSTTQYNTIEYNIIQYSTI